MKRIKWLSAITLLVMVMGLSLVGCPKPEPETQRPAIGHIDTYEGEPRILLNPGTEDVRRLFQDMEGVPHLTEESNSVILVHGHDHDYWHYFGPRFDYHDHHHYYVDVVYDEYGRELPALDESVISWGILVGYNNEQITLLPDLKPFNRGNFEEDLRRVVPDRVKGKVKIWIVAQYPGAEPQYCPIQNNPQAATFCFARLKDQHGQKIWNIQVGGQEIDEVMVNGVGQGYYEINWPLGTGETDDGGELGVVRINTTNKSVYIDPLGHTNKGRLYGNPDMDMKTTPEQIGGFFWFPEFPNANGTPHVRYYTGDAEVLNLENIFALAPAGATYVAFAALAYDFDYANPYPLLNHQWDWDWVERQFTAGFPWWWRINEWNVTLDGQAVHEQMADGKGLGWIKIPIPSMPIQQYIVSTGTPINGTISGGGTYASGATATLTATPANGYVFNGWSGDFSGNTNPLVFTVTGNKTVTATFVLSGGVPTAAKIQINRSGSTASMSMFTAQATLFDIVADASQGLIPAGSTINDIVVLGAEALDLPGQYGWYILEEGTTSVTANSWSSAVMLDGHGIDGNGASKDIALANWKFGRVVPFIKLRTLPGVKLPIDMGAVPTTVDSTTLSNNGSGWPN